MASQIMWFGWLAQNRILQCSVCVCSLELEEQIREAWSLKCSFVVKEIMQTELAYVQSLADIIKVAPSRQLE